MEKIKKIFGLERTYYIILILTTALACIFVLPLCINEAVNYDSAYQYFLQQHSLPEIISLLREDYSPPLYATILYVVTSIFGKTIYVMRATGVIVVAGLEYISLFPVRKAFGVKASLLSACMFLFTSANFQCFYEIRPHVFAYFFVAGASVYAYLAYFRGEKKDYVCLTVFSLCSMYTHNIGMLYALGLYISVLIFSVIQKNKTKLKNFLISGICCAVGYIPWLANVIFQYKNVLNHYWVGRIYTFTYILKKTSAKLFDSSLNVASRMVISLTISAVVILYAVKIFKSGKLSRITSFSQIKEVVSDKFAVKLVHAAFIVLVYLVPIIVYMLFCVLVYPITAGRYLYIFLGWLVISLAVLIANLGYRFPCVVLVVMSVFSFCVSCITTSKNNKQSTFEDMIEYIYNEHPDGNVAFVNSHEWTIGIMAYYFPNAKIYVYDDTWCVLTSYDVFGDVDIIDIGDFDNISDYEDEFYFFDTQYPSTDYTVGELIDTDEYDIDRIGVYEEEQTYVQTWELCKAEKK